MKKTPNTSRKVAITAFSLTATMILAPAQLAGPERASTTNRNVNDRQAAFIPRAIQRSRDTRDNSPNRNESSRPIAIPTENRSVNGSGNNLANPTWGMAQETTIRILGNAYADGYSTPAGAERPSPRAISNALIAQSESIVNSRGATDYLWQWGQFVDHDIIETPSADPAEAFDIPVPLGDPHFDPFNSGSATIALNRSLYEDHDGVREQVNEISAYIDASQVYGSDDSRAFALRSLDGSGKLKVTESEHGDLLPYNEAGFANAPAPSSNFFLAGDVRANEQAGLTALHTLFVREHNYWAEEYAASNPLAQGEEIYQFARMVVAAEIQAITYREFLPVLLGKNALPDYRGYREDVRADLSNSFGAAAFRIGHSMLSAELLRVDAEGNEIEAGHLSLAGSFFNPALIEEEGIAPLLRGLAAQECQELDAHLVDEVRNLLFGPPGAGGFDLASLNIQRGRDHGIPDYNSARVSLGFAPVSDMTGITENTTDSEALASVYASPDQVDLWVGGLCETDVPGSMVGETYQAILVDQFTRLRDGDRFYYRGALPQEMVEMIEEQTLATIIRRNTEIGDELPDHVFANEEAETITRPNENDGRQRRQSSTRRSRR